MPESAPGYPVQDSASSRRGLGFTVSNGERVPNEGQSVLDLEADNGRGSHAQRASTLQVADLRRPLMSESQICDQGFECVCQDTHALVVNSVGETACRFERSEQRYSAKMTLKSPEPFHQPS